MVARAVLSVNIYSNTSVMLWLIGSLWYAYAMPYKHCFELLRK